MKKIVSIALVLLAVMAFRLPEKHVRIFMVGDSTMANQPTDDNPQRGWGQLFPNYFTNEVEIKNYAVNGRSTKSYIDQGRWDSVLKQLQPGDYVLIQFGHNDSKIEDTARYAAPQTTYKTNLIRFVNEARNKGAIPVLITPVMRRKFDSTGKFIDQHGQYPGVVRDVAKDMKVPLVDLHKSSQALIEQQGVEGSKKMFLFIPANHFKNYKGKAEDDTHFTEYGASQVASLVCADIKKLNLDLAKYLKPSDFDEKLAFELPKIYMPHFQRDTFNIVNYGAKSGGVEMNTKAINDAIIDCNAKGGGVVLIPQGTWLSGPIVIKSNVNLHVDKGALVLFSSNFNDYPLVKSNFEGTDAARCQSPLSALNETNIAITGQGIFDGSGDAWRPVKKAKVSGSEWKRLILTGVVTADGSTWFPTANALKGYNDNNIGKLVPGKELTDFADIKDFLRPNFVNIISCKNVFFQDFTVTNSPAWNLHLMYDEDVTLDRVNVKNPFNSQNTDAIDIECSKNVNLENSTFDTGDDAICLKSGRDEEGRKRGIPTENVIINNCTVYRAHGGFVIGSEMSGGVKNIYVSNCTFIGTDVGFRFKSVRGRGGVVENIYANNISMKDIAAEALYFDVYYQATDPVPVVGEKIVMPKIEMKPIDEGTPTFQHFYLKNIVCEGAEKGIFIRGLPEMNIKDVTIENAVLQSNQGVYCEEASGICLKNVTVLSNNTNPVITVENSNNIAFDNFQYKKDADMLMSVGGERTTNISITNTDLKLAKQQTQFVDNATEKVLTIH